MKYLLLMSALVVGLQLGLAAMDRGEIAADYAQRYRAWQWKEAGRRGIRRCCGVVACNMMCCGGLFFTASNPLPGALCCLSSSMPWFTFYFYRESIRRPK